MYKNFFSLILFVVLTSCHFKKDKNDIINADRCIVKKDVSLPFHQDTIKILKTYFDTASKKNYIFVYTVNQNMYYTTTSDNVVNRIFLISKYSISDMYIKSPDSIYLFADDMIALINLSGKLVDIIDIDNADDRYYFSASALYPFYVIDTLAFFYKYNKGVIGSYSQYIELISSDRECCYDIKNKRFFKLKNQPGRYPVDLKKNFKYVFNPFRIIDDRHNLIYSFEHSDSIEVYNFIDCQKKKACVHSHFFKENNNFDFNAVRDYDKVAEYLITNSRYYLLHYDPYREVYYRIVLHSYKYKEGKNVYLRTDVPWSIVVINKDFKVLKEVFFQPGKHYFNFFIILPEGVLIKQQSYENNYSLFNFIDTV